MSVRTLRELIAAACVLLCALGAGAAPCDPRAQNDLRVPVLLYHRLGPTVADSMTVRLEHFDAQLQALDALGYRVIPLRDLMAALRDPRRSVPRCAVVLVADDGHVSVYRYLLPRARARHMPVTLFIYPSAISNASYAMTWQQLDALRATGLFDLQSHTYWHPNLRVEQRRQAPQDFAAFLRKQFEGARKALQRHGAGDVTLLAWPFGVHDPAFYPAARAAGYEAAFTIDRRPVTRVEQRYALPRYIVTDADVGARFERLLHTATTPPTRAR